MQKAFELSIISAQRMVLLSFLIVGGTALVLFTSAQVFDLLDAAGSLDSANRSIRMSTFFLLFAPGAYGLYRLVRAIGGEAVSVVVSPSQLSVLYHKTGEEVLVPFEIIASYHYINFRGNADLGLKLQDGSRFRLAINSYFQDAHNFTEMVIAFEGSLHRYQHNQVSKGGPTVQLREKPFFERPIATIFLVGLLILTADLTRKGYSGTSPVQWGSLIGLYGTLIAYLGAWIGAKDKRRQ